jgi:hypothetical protein
MMRFSRYLSVAVALTGILGCYRGDDHVAPMDTAAGQDAQIMHALDFYNPMYKVNAEGRVQFLRLGGRYLPDAVLAQVGKLTALRNLGLAWSTVTDDELAHLKDLQNLRAISLVGSPITDEGLIHLEKLASLQWAWLPRQGVTEEGAQKLKAARPELHVQRQ